MKTLKIPYYFVVLMLCCFSFNYSLGQNRDFKADSLQIKVYTEIEYLNSQSQEITVKKVFCDYCSENQINFLKKRARELAFYDRYNPKKRIENGTRKFAIILRVSKKDFSEMRTKKDSINN